MNESYVKNKFSLLNGGLFNMYMRSMHSSSVEQKDDRYENNNDNNNTMREKLNLGRLLAGMAKGTKKGTETEREVNTKLVTQKGTEGIKEFQYIYEERIEPSEFPLEESEKETGNFLAHMKEEGNNDLKLLEKKFNNEVMQSYYNNTCYVYDDKNTKYRKPPIDGKDGKYNEYIEHDEYINKWRNIEYDKHYYNKSNNNNSSSNNSSSSSNGISNSSSSNNNIINNMNSNGSMLYFNKDKTKRSEDLLIHDEINTKDYYLPNTREDNTIYYELKKLKNDVTLLQMMNINLQKQLISTHCSNATKNPPPQHIIINNKTEVASSAVNNIEKQNEKKNKGILYIFLKKILSSRFNQMIFISSIFVSCFLINKQWQKALKVAQLEKKVNSNILLKSVKMLEETMGIRKLSYI